MRDVVGERRGIIVFDRGGWSPKLFGAMIKDGFGGMTYRVGRCRLIELLATDGDIRVSENELQIMLAPLSSHWRAAFNPFRTV